MSNTLTKTLIWILFYEMINEYHFYLERNPFSPLSYPDRLFLFIKLRDARLTS